jgi:hypothetical protein
MRIECNPAREIECGFYRDYCALARDALRVVAARIGARVDVPSQRLLEGDLARAAQELIVVGYRRVSRKHYPDRGGDGRQMAANSVDEARQGELTVPTAPSPVRRT